MFVDVHYSQLNSPWVRHGYRQGTDTLELLTMVLVAVDARSRTGADIKKKKKITGVVFVNWDWDNYDKFAGLHFLITTVLWMSGSDLTFIWTCGEDQNLLKLSHRSQVNWTCCWNWMDCVLWMKEIGKNRKTSGWTFEAHWVQLDVDHVEDVLIDVL